MYRSCQIEVASTSVSLIISGIGAQAIASRSWRRCSAVMRSNSAVCQGASRPPGRICDQVLPYSGTQRVR